MKELSKETINIEGVDYTLFLNRAGIVAFEKYAKHEFDDLSELSKKYKNVEVDDSSIDFDSLDDDANPFEGLEEINDIDKDIEKVSKIFKRLYWIMLYTEHHLSINDASKLYDKACEEYGAQQLIALGQQMINEVNNNPSGDLKNLKALKPMKN